MLILVVNCGSSSAKYQLFDIKKNRCLAKGLIERIGQRASSLKHQVNGTTVEKRVECRDHFVAIHLIVGTLVDPCCGVIRSKNEISGVGHRVVHGGETFKASTLITNEVIRTIERYCGLAPLHNPPSLLGIKACAKILKGIPQAAVFDTAFHQTMPREAYLYAVPFKYYEKYGVRRYGFHGTSHRFVAKEGARLLRKSQDKLRLITCHLGNGCSMTAVDRGISVDTSMGFTPLEGLIMGTRSGDLDPAVVFYLMGKDKLSSQRMNDILNKESGLLGISGVSNDMRDLLEAVSVIPRQSSGQAGQGSKIKGERARLAIEMFIYRIKKYIGAYQAAMGGLDAVVFTAGISENNPWLVERIRKDLRNVVERSVKFMVVPTNEELLIAEDTFGIIRQV